MKLSLVADYREVQVWDLELGRRLRTVSRPRRGDLADAQLLVDGRLAAQGVGGVLLWGLPEVPPRPLGLTNIRVCRGDFAVVRVAPWPDLDDPWAPPEACPLAAEVGDPP